MIRVGQLQRFGVAIGCKKLAGAVGDNCCPVGCRRCKKICENRVPGINGEHDINVKCTCRTCKGFVLNKPGEQPCPTDKCRGHGLIDKRGNIRKHDDGKCHGHEPETVYKCYFGEERDEFGNCTMKCKDCLFIFWAMFPEKFHAMMGKIRATFANSSESSRATTKSLVGKRIPEEINNEKYPALRPRAYAGLSSA
ncbi:hypothetical protein BBBOND_0210850 [Babesia bigemina]|uniref:Uncharacterized protein n=1 Tax=Babesia bigemina TaxID=5866 RepID=A0A061DD42_BABBI|nr:hypothetical protein BBBOND_0210850 [Babesia bigemina]CDR95935.1 hypothetical protein BBBOND_0210850 [Babesia bigemina]|eukprot:XP_012768121.1 hypothetical protein BBBOND_0210850 [Babesia bigemina]